MNVSPALSAGEERFDVIRRRVGLVAAPLLSLSLLVSPVDGLDPVGQRLAAVVVLTVTLWVTEAIPLAVSALLGPALAILLGVAPAKQALAPFANPFIFLFLGGFLMAAALSRQGLDRRVALWILGSRGVASSPVRATVGIALVAYVFSMWISNTATTAMMIPIALGLHATMARTITDPEGQRRLSRYAGGMCLTLAYAASVGGIATPIGTAPNVIAIDLLAQSGYPRFDFFQWMSFALPLSLVFLLIVLAVTTRWFKPPAQKIEGLGEEVRRQLAELGPLQAGERRVAVVFLIAVAGWLAPSLLKLTLGVEHDLTQWARGSLHEGVVAILCASTLFALPSGKNRKPLLVWEDAKHIDWGTLLLLGGGIALGKMMVETGLADYVGRGVIASVGDWAKTPLGLTVATTTLVIFMTEITSNTATITMMLPVILGIAKTSGLDPTPTALCVTIAGSLAFMLPVSTPPNAIAYGTGRIRIDQMVRVGLRLDLLCLVTLLAIGAVVLPSILPDLAALP